MSGYIGNIPVPQATQTRESFTATASQTTFNTAGYTPNFLDVFLNGVHLLNGTDYTATNGSDVVLTTGAAASDVVEVISYSTYEVNSQTYTGGLTVNNDGATVLTVDRATSDGTIIDLKKDGTTVGSVASKDGDLAIGTGTIGIRFLDGSSAIVPQNHSTNSGTDGLLDIGVGAARFKDLYLSGGVYLGGTGAANLLDDVEFGTFTPVFERTGTQPSVTYTGRSGYYTKVGDTVFISLQLGVSSWSGGSGTFRIGGLPFAVQSGGGAYYSQATSIDHSYITLSPGYTEFGGYFASGATIITMIASGSGVSSSTGSVTPQTTFSVYYSGHYRTTA